MSKSTRRGPYAKTAQVRQSIIDAAYSALAANGFRGLTMREVAARVGMTAPGLAYYFPDKESLLSAALQERQQRGPGPDWETAGVSSIAETIEAVLEANMRDTAFAELHCILSAEATASDHPAHDFFRERYSTSRREIAAVVSRWVASGELQTHLSPETVSVLVLAVLDGVQLQWLLDPDAVDLRGVITAFLSELFGITTRATAAAR